MHRLIRLILVTSPALLLAAPAPPARPAAAEFYVAPHGADTWSGTWPESPALKLGFRPIDLKDVRPRAVPPP